MEQAAPSRLENGVTIPYRSLNNVKVHAGMHVALHHTLCASDEILSCEILLQSCLQTCACADLYTRSFSDQPVFRDAGGPLNLLHPTDCGHTDVLQMFWSFSLEEVFVELQSTRKRVKALRTWKGLRAERYTKHRHQQRTRHSARLKSPSLQRLCAQCAAGVHSCTRGVVECRGL
jgi:hypothetical protein